MSWLRLATERVKVRCVLVLHGYYCISLSTKSITQFYTFKKKTRCDNNNLLISKISWTCFGQCFAYLQERKTEILQHMV